MTDEEKLFDLIDRWRANAKSIRGKIARKTASPVRSAVADTQEFCANELEALLQKS